MFHNSGAKIKALAYITCILGFFISLFLGIAKIMNVVGILIILIGCLSSWISGLLLYGFGHLICNSDKLVKHLIPEEQKQTPVYEPQPSEPWVCFNCGTTNHARAAYCIKCDTNRAWSEEKSKQG